eukprot:scaffold17308_cov30-Phaeocystis_antarctica.AAC.1
MMVHPGQQENRQRVIPRLEDDEQLSASGALLYGTGTQLNMFEPKLYSRSLSLCRRAQTVASISAAGRASMKRSIFAKR